MKRGEVWWVEFSSPQGGEVRKTRPAVIVSNDAANKFSNRVQIVPLTSRTDKLYPCEAYVTLNGERAKAMADQIATAAKQRLRDHIDTLSQNDMDAVAQAIRVQLGL